MMKKDQKFFIQASNIHFQLYFKVHPLKNTLITLHILHLWRLQQSYFKVF